MQNLGLKTCTLEKLWNNIEIMNTHNLLCQKFALSKFSPKLAVSVWQMQLPSAPTFLTHQRAGCS